MGGRGFFFGGSAVLPVITSEICSQAGERICIAISLPRTSSPAREQVQVIKDTKVMYKSQLQEYAQRASITPPVYDFVKGGSSHHPCFKGSVIINGIQYESAPGFRNLKSAEHAAAKVALDALHQTNSGAGVTPSPVHESGLCKNLLQEYTQKSSLPLPVYNSLRSGVDHAPTFSSSVEVAGVHYSGGIAKSRKEAEIKAARTALLSIKTTQAIPTDGASSLPKVPLPTLINAQLPMPASRKRGRPLRRKGDGPALTKVKVQQSCQPVMNVKEMAVTHVAEERIAPVEVPDAVVASTDVPLSKQAPSHNVQKVLSKGRQKKKKRYAKLVEGMVTKKTEKFVVPIDDGQRSLVALQNGIEGAKPEEHNNLKPEEQAAGFMSLSGSDWRTT